MKMNLPILIFVLLFSACDKHEKQADPPVNDCAQESHIYSFTANGKKYELVRENKTWKEAAACAVARGGYLAEINSAAENQAVFNELANNAGIDLSHSIANDGGGATYVWLGGTDQGTEGQWIWDGNNDSAGTQFWDGGVNGHSVGGLYTNWGHEPDNYGTGQDYLGLALTQWPLSTGNLGTPGHWNDIKGDNQLFYLIEYNP